MSEHGTFIWNELDTPDQHVSGSFFEKLLGWSRREVNAGGFGTYTLFQKNGRDVAGMMNPTTETSMQKRVQKRCSSHAPHQRSQRVSC